MRFTCLFEHLIEFPEEDLIPSKDEELNVGDMEQNYVLLNSTSDVLYLQF